MYKEDILDMYRNPRNEGEIEDAIVQEGENPSCGDDTDIFIQVENDEIKEIKHKTDGCAISTAAISIITDEIKGMKVDEVKELDKDWILDKLGIDISPMRMKCALLGLKTVQQGLDDY